MSVAPRTVSGFGRRGFLAGALLVAFSCRASAQEGGGDGPPVVAPALPGSLDTFPLLDSWIRLDAGGRATVFTGKAELGQGIATALVQLAAGALDLPAERVTLVTADTARTPDEGVTAGSHSMQKSGTAILNAASDVRLLLCEAAISRWNVDIAQVATRDGVVLGPDGRSVDYGALAGSLSLQVAARADAFRRACLIPAGSRLIGASLPRIDIPAKLTGGAAYVQDLRLPGMLHARVLRGPCDGTRPKPADLEAMRRLPGIDAVVQDGGFVAVLAQREWDAITALRRLQEAGWERTAPDLPPGVDGIGLNGALQRLPSRPVPIFGDAGVAASGIPAVAGTRTIQARYTRPYLMHGSIVPSCAVALWQDGGLTVWTHSQGVFPLRKALADLLRMPPERIRCIQVEGAGCYGHNGADDVAADAALAARAVPGRPVRMQWMREQEHGWEPLGPAMTVELEATLDEGGRIAGWRHQVWSNTHNGRPTSGGGLIAGTELQPPFPVPPPKPIPMPEGGGDRNANPIYDLPGAGGVYHFIPAMPVRVSALRSLGAQMNVFAIESFMDELAVTAGTDPIAFRLAVLADPRACAVIQMASERFGWAGRSPGGGGAGHGFGFARYKNLGAYCAVVMTIAVEHETGRAHVRRVVAVVDSGEAVNPDGIANQVEGAIVQSLSWTTQEQVGLDRNGRTGFDWSSYPILRFEDVPDTVEVHVINRPDMPFLGTGEAGQGPAAAAFANALADATGIRFRAMPLTQDRIKAALGV